ncbi:MAG: LPS export ABC transporter periplasmic protein LptC [Rhodospirillaceae bacterium]|nr:LPS export ABC transporter periplasmic protein LptC [Rhodospirillaceae bacterium]
MIDVPNHNPDGHGEDDRRGAWQPRHTDVRGSVEKYSRFVSTMKVVLPTAAGLLLAVVIILPQLRPEPEQFAAEVAVVEGSIGNTLSLVNARYLGTDISGQPFSVTAKTVREPAGDDNNIELTAPQADISLNDGTWLMVGAESGQYHRETQTLTLEGEVNLFQDQGYELHTQTATVMLEEGSASSTTPVSSQGPFGQLQSQGFKLQGKGKIVYFTGPARLVLNSAGKTSGAP